MPLYYFPLFIIILIGGYIFYQTNQRKWNESLLSSDENIVYEEEYVSFHSYRAQNVGREMKNLFLRATNKRIFLLLPNKKTIYVVLDFTTAKENSIKNNIGKATMYVNKNSLKIVTEDGRTWLLAEGQNFMGLSLQYGVETKNEKEIKKILGL